MKKMMILLLVLVVLTGCQKSSNTDEKSLVVGMECNYAPFNWTTLTKNEHTIAISDVDYCDGYDVVIADTIAKALNRKLVIKKIAWEGLEPALSASEIDAIIAGMTKTPQRAENADFTNPYYESEMVMIVAKDSPLAQAKSIQDFSGKKVLGQLNTLYDEIIDQIDGVIHLTPLTSYPLMVVALQNQEADALTAEYPVAQGVISANPDLVMVRFDKENGFEADATVSIAVKKGNTELLNDIQKVLDTISDEMRQEWMLAATKRQPAGE